MANLWLASCLYLISWVGAQIGYVSSGLVGCTVKEDPFIIVAKTLRMSTPTGCCPYLLFLSPHCRVPFLAHTDGSVCGHSVRPQSRLWTNADGREEDIEKHSNNH